MWHLRFSHAIWNHGAGDPEVHCWHDRFSGTVRVRQLLRDDERMPGYLLGFPIPEMQGERPRTLRGVRLVEAGVVAGLAGNLRPPAGRAIAGRQ